MSRNKLNRWLIDAFEAHKQGNLDIALELYRKVIIVDSKNADATHLSGLVEYQRQNLNKANELVSRAIKLNAHVPVFWNTRGLIESGMGNATAAIKSYQRAISIDPRYADAWTNMGVSLHLIGQFDKADNCYKTALEINPRDINTLRNMGQLLSDNKHYSQAASVYELILQLSPNDNKSFAALTFINQYRCHWDGIQSRHNHINQLVEARVDSFITPFAYLSMSTSPKMQLLCAEASSRHTMAALERLAHPHRISKFRKNEKKTRVAYWSSDFQQHATSHLLAEVIECHEKKEFEIILLSYGKDDGGACAGALSKLQMILLMFVKAIMEKL